MGMYTTMFMTVYISIFNLLYSYVWKSVKQKLNLSNIILTVFVQLKNNNSVVPYKKIDVKESNYLKFTNIESIQLMIKKIICSGSAFA